MRKHTMKLIAALSLVCSGSFAYCANFVRLGEYGNEIDTTSIRKEGDLVHYVIRRSHFTTPKMAVNTVVNCKSRQRAEKGNPPGVSVNNEAFVEVAPDTPNATELDVACGNMPMPAAAVPSPSKLEEMEAEIQKRVALEWAGPKKTYIKPSTQDVGHAMYYDKAKKKIEKVGTLNFPKLDGKSLYGEVIVSIPIFQDGTIYEKDGGPQIEKSSGIAELDQAALRIVRRSAPFEQISKSMRTPGRSDVWVIFSRFNFTRIEDEAPQLQPLSDRDQAE